MQEGETAILCAHKSRECAVLILCSFARAASLALVDGPQRTFAPWVYACSLSFLSGC